jgi:flagella basal body P-ring formation protein FlgA
VAAICLSLVAGVSARQAERDVRVRALVADAARARVPAAAVTVDLRLVRLAPGLVPDAAEPEPGIRFARPARFRLLAGRKSVGYAVAVVHVEARHVRVTRTVPAGAALSPQDIEVVTGDPGAELLEPLPGLSAVLGAAARRTLHLGEVVTLRAVRVPPAVRSGDRVTTRAVVEGAEATSEAVALQSGEIGDVIRLVNPESRRQLEGVVVDRAVVEVRYES